ncbi:uncharacterized protein [Marmota flaviventris]|uniref:uncharacterized protein n=1 Tax=Marmota flaviventris TaxID=93162 RepID=UPI003A892E23
MVDKERCCVLCSLWLDGLHATHCIAYRPKAPDAGADPAGRARTVRPDPPQRLLPLRELEAVPGGIAAPLRPRPSGARTAPGVPSAGLTLLPSARRRQVCKSGRAEAALFAAGCSTKLAPHPELQSPPASGDPARAPGHPEGGRYFLRMCSVPRQGDEAGVLQTKNGQNTGDLCPRKAGHRDTKHIAEITAAEEIDGPPATQQGVHAPTQLHEHMQL